jgi:hypothetical protein
MGLPDATTMLQKAGIDLTGFHEVEVVRLVKAMKSTQPDIGLKDHKNITTIDRQIAMKARSRI